MEIFRILSSYHKIIKGNQKEASKKIYKLVMSKKFAKNNK